MEDTILDQVDEMSDILTEQQDDIQPASGSDVCQTLNPEKNTSPTIEQTIQLDDM